MTTFQLIELLGNLFFAGAKKIFSPYSLLVLFFPFFLKADTISMRSMPASDFWEKVYPIGSIPFTVALDPNDPTLLSYHLNREKNGEWYLTGNGNGQFWQLDSNRVWHRLDNTIYRGYDFDSYCIRPNMKYGGYGFWKTNGTLTVYQYQGRSWEVVPLSRELPVHSAYCYYDAKQNILYQVGSIYLKQPSKENLEIIDSLFTLDLASNNWKTIGKLNPQAEYFLKPNLTLGHLVTPTGKLLYSDLADTCAMIDFRNMTCIIPNAVASKRFFDFMQKSKDGHLLVSTKSAILLVDTNEFKIRDSIVWNNILDDPFKILPILSAEATENDPVHPAILYGTGFLLLAGTWMFYKRKTNTNKDNPSTPATVAEPATNTIPATENYALTMVENRLFFNGKQLQELMGENELKLLTNLYEKKKLDQALNTVQFNELLGIDNRSPDNQKKIRSEVVKGVNLGLKELGFPHEAVRRIRHAEDRRMMMYFLHEAIH